MARALSKWRKHGDAREAKRRRDQIAALLQQTSGARLAGRPIVDPEEDDSHLIEPQKVGQMGRQIRWGLGVGALESHPKMGNALFPNLAGLSTKRGKRTGGIAGRTEESAEELPVWPELIQFRRDERADSRREVSMPGKKLGTGRIELDVCLPVERHHDRFLRGEVVVGGARSDIGFLRDVAHRRFGETPLLEEVQRSREDAAARLLGLRRRADSSRGAARRLHALAPAAASREGLAAGRSPSLSEISLRLRESSSKACRGRGSRVGRDRNCAHSRYSRRANRHMIQACASRYTAPSLSTATSSAGVS